MRSLATIIAFRSVMFLLLRRENTVLRANLPPKSVYVIPNAIVVDHFRPARSVPPTDTSQCPLLFPAMIRTF